MAGITRIIITDRINGRGAYRFRESAVMRPYANLLYRSIFKKMGVELAPGDEEKQCTKQEFLAGYDHVLGIDVILAFLKGIGATLQEKFLKTDFYTLTVEYMQDWRNQIPGDWFNMRCQYYFTGYYDIEHPENGFSKYVLVNWPSLQIDPSIVWAENHNQCDGALASFRYISFRRIPMQHIIAGQF
jgi:hypothetical protein